MIKFNATILKFDRKGEKTGWSYIEVTKKQAESLCAGKKVSFRVKGMFDRFAIKQTALLPMGDGNFILPLNATMRKGIGKKVGDKITVTLEWDQSKFEMSADFMICLEDEPHALSYFIALPASHQRYFGKWIDSAKTDATKAKRLTRAVNALARRMGYAEMLREGKGRG